MLLHKSLHKYAAAYFVAAVKAVLHVVAAYSCCA